MAATRKATLRASAARQAKNEADRAGKPRRSQKYPRDGLMPKAAADLPVAAVDPEGAPRRQWSPSKLPSGGSFANMPAACLAPLTTTAECAATKPVAPMSLR